jgi:hypothetical protein
VVALAPLTGYQEPRLSVVPPGEPDGRAERIIGLGEASGLTLDPWQRLVLEEGLRSNVDGLNAALEVLVWVSRQNGKSAITALLVDCAPSVLQARKVIYTAHEFKTARETFDMAMALIEDGPLSDDFVKSLRGNNETSIRLNYRDDCGRKRLATIYFMARTRSAGRGFSSDLLILDEAFSVQAHQIGAVMPTLSARPNPQIWYLTTGAMHDSEQLHLLRRRALGPEPGNLAYLEWSALPGVDRADRQAWAMANPALGRRLTERWIATELEAMPAREFERERLGIGDDPDGANAVDMDKWLALVDAESEAIRPMGFGLAINPERSWAAVGVAGVRLDGNAHIETVDDLPGVEWVTARAVEIYNRWKVPIWIQLGSPAATHIEILEAVGVEVRTHPEGGGAAALLADAIKAGTLRHLGQASLTRALTGARKRTIGDRWTWNRASSADEISPLEAVSLAHYGAMVEPPAPIMRKARVL